MNSLLKVDSLMGKLTLMLETTPNYRKCVPKCWKGLNLMIPSQMQIAIMMTILMFQYKRHKTSPRRSKLMPKASLKSAKPPSL